MTARFGGMLSAVFALLVPSAALADGHELTFRVEPGVAVPLTKPQTDHYNVGGDLTLKPSLGLTPWLDASLSFSGLILPTKNETSDGTALGLGGGLRLKRPHDGSNTDAKWTAVSPWFDADLQYVRTGPLDRAAFSLGLGAEFPTNDNRDLWAGPFVRYLDILDSVNDRAGYDHTDAHVFIAGVSFEFGGGTTKVKYVPVFVPTVLPCPEPAAKKLDPKPIDTGEPPKIESVIKITEKVQFPFDSAKPLPVSGGVLSETLKVLLKHQGWNVEIQGYTSSEGKLAYNTKLSLKRAQAVKDVLVKGGVPEDRLTVKGFGPANPVASNATEAGRETNRRVEFVVEIVLKKAEVTK